MEGKCYSRRIVCEYEGCNETAGWEVVTIPEAVYGNVERQVLCGTYKEEACETTSG